MTTLERPVLVLTDHSGDETTGYTLTEASAQLLTLARGLTSAEVVAVALTREPDSAALAEQGVSTVLIPEFGHYSPRVSTVVADALVACISRVDPALVLCAANYHGREVVGAVGALLSCGAVVDVTTLEVDDEGIIATKTALAGSWTTRLRITSGPAVVAVRPSGLTAQPAETPTSPTRVEVPVVWSSRADAVEVVSSQVQESTGRVSLTEARTVVVGGRGTEGDFTLVEALADALGGAVGATRVCSDEGWVPRSIQIGQTGVNISPDLYIGVGVSGAIHHTVGMQSSAHIVAVCDDPDAPIFEICDFGIVGDLFEVIPQTLAALDRARTEQ